MFNDYRLINPDKVNDINQEEKVDDFINEKKIWKLQTLINTSSRKFLKKYQHSHPDKQY